MAAPAPPSKLSIGGRGRHVDSLKFRARAADPAIDREQGKCQLVPLPGNTTSLFWEETAFIAKTALVEKFSLGVLPHDRYSFLVTIDHVRDCPDMRQKARRDLMVASIHTNSSAMTALTNLDNTQNQMSKVQNQIGTGYKVASATDNGAVYAIAQGLRADISGIAAVNQELTSAEGTASVADSAATSISNEMSSIK
ncbi:MAG: flagellin, partial [Azospirillaceae bacterium]|nr:flagellin [Azospirillaceae bacterium]